MAAGLATASRAISQSIGIIAGGVGRAFQTMIMGGSLAAVKLAGAAGLIIRPWLEIGRSMGGIASAYVRALGSIWTASMKLVTGLLQLLPRLLQTLGDSLQRIGQQLTGIGTRLLFLGGLMLAPIVAATKSFVTAGTELERLSAKTGDSVENLSALGFAAKMANVDLASLTPRHRPHAAIPGWTGRGWCRRAGHSYCSKPNDTRGQDRAWRHQPGRPTAMLEG